MIPAIVPVPQATAPPTAPIAPIAPVAWRFTLAPTADGRPQTFAVALPEGNYTVTVTLGGGPTASVTTVRAEARRLMLQQIATPPGKRTIRTFTVNVHDAHIAGGDGDVKLKPRDMQPTLNPDWDDLLTLEFTGDHPAVQSIDIAPAPASTPTVFLLGDSTVTDQTDEPWAAWGQMLPRFFAPGVAVANYAESGATLRSTIASRRLVKVLSLVKTGDWVLIQYGHNDQKERGAGIGAFTSYAADLRADVDRIRARGGQPILVTPMNRRRFDAAGKIVPTLGDYPDAVRRVAKDAGVPLIDLNAMSRDLFEAMGQEGTLKAFVHYPANTFPGQTVALKDDTHFNEYGAYELARCIVSGIRAQVPALAAHLANDIPTDFDPRHPDPVAAWSLPPSPPRQDVPTTKPEGN